MFAWNANTEQSGFHIILRLYETAGEAKISLIASYLSCKVAASVSPWNILEETRNDLTGLLSLSSSYSDN